MIKSTLLALAVLTIQGTYAHPHFAVDEALPGTTLNTSIVINHGCKGSPTTEVSISVPKEITSIEPIDVANFTLSIDYRNSSQQGDGGNNSSQTISGFRWSGNLDPSTPQEFAMVMGIPSLDVSHGNVTLYFPTTQTCANATVEMTVKLVLTMIIFLNTPLFQVDSCLAKCTSNDEEQSFIGYSSSISLIQMWMEYLGLHVLLMSLSHYKLTSSTTLVF
ncbi:hypothetical protein BDC45DRAFT_535998 [Circinella umbellata]|nr:hypothetical protein BDC45DRAFT_535998 [Circinella umbellata]